MSENTPDNSADSKETIRPAGNNLPTAVSLTQTNSTMVKGIPRSAVLALVLCLIMAVVLVFTYRQVLIQQRHLSQLNATLSQQTTNMETVQQQISILQTGLSEEQQLRQSLDEHQQAVDATLDTITARLGRTSLTWRLAEIEYLLMIANHRLSLADDVDTAITIFDIADNRLADLANPRLLGVRQAVADELLALRSLEQTDITGIVLSLSSILNEVERLPLIEQQRVAVGEKVETRTMPDTWRELPRVIWNNIKSLVTVRYHEKPIEPLLPPKETWYLRQSLRLKLEQARLAALREETVLFRQYLTEADRWIEEFYQIDATTVVAMRATMAKMMKMELRQTLPDVTESLQRLRKVIGEQDLLGSANRGR